MKLFISTKSMENDEEFKKSFVAPLIIGSILFSIVAIFINIELNFGKVLKLTPYITLVCYSLLFILVWKKKIKIELAKWILIAFTLIVTILLWYYNFGSQGPVLYLYVVIFSYSIFMLDGKQFLLVTIIMVLNVLALFYIEYHNPAIVGHYPSVSARIDDVYSGLLLYLFIMYVLMSQAKRNFITEYHKAQRADRLKSSFLANMSHEIRTPLNAIVGFSNLIAEENLSPDERKQYVSIINSSNESLLRLVNDILDVSMIESDQLKVETKECDLNKIMNELEETYKLKLRSSGNNQIQISKITPNDDYHIKTDCERLKQILINLLDNAIKYTEKGKIEFGYEPEKKDFLFFVKDTGIGIKEHHHKHLFDRFYKVEDDNNKLFRGTGIGLYLTRQVVQLLNGKIWVHSEYGKGSEFYFNLPSVGLEIVHDYEGDAIEVSEVAKKEIENDVLQVQNTKLTILIVEDHLSNQEYYKAILKNQPYKLIHAMNGLEGVEAFKKNKDIRLILMDIKMPVMDGFEALREIRKINKDVKVFALTAHALASDKQKCLNAGFNGYFSKPLNKSVLLKEIKLIEESK